MVTIAICSGLVAAYIQLWRGTKYSRFPAWLDQWLKMRKQLGLIMLGLACMHVSYLLINKITISVSLVK